MNTEERTSLTASVQALLVEALRVTDDQVPADLEFGDLPQWDSMGHMEVMMLLEEKYGVEINADTIANLISIPAICSYIEANNGNH